MINYLGHFSERMSHSLLFFLRVLLLFQTEMSTPSPLYIHYIYKFGLENNRQAEQFTVGFGKLWPFSQMTAARMKRWENGAVGQTSRRRLNRIGWYSTPSETFLMNYNINNPINFHVIWCLLHPLSFIQISSSFILPKYISGDLGLYTYEILTKDWRHVNILSWVESHLDIWHKTSQLFWEIFHSLSNKPGDLIHRDYCRSELNFQTQAESEERSDNMHGSSGWQSLSASFKPGWCLFWPGALKQSFVPVQNRHVMHCNVHLFKLLVPFDSVLPVMWHKKGTEDAHAHTNQCQDYQKQPGWLKLADLCTITCKLTLMSDKTLGVEEIPNSGKSEMTFFPTVFDGTWMNGAFLLPGGWKRTRWGKIAAKRRIFSHQFLEIMQAWWKRLLFLLLLQGR